MEIKTLNKTQEDKINKIIDKRVKDNYETYFKTVSADFVGLFDGVTFKEFSERMRD